MTAASSSTDKSAESLDIFTRCIDESAIPETNEGFLNYSISYDSPFLEDNYNDTLLYITLHTDNVIADKGWDYYDTWYVLEDGIFNCTHLPICTITCSGVDESAVKGSTHNAGCFTELMFHATIFRFLVAFSIYVCLNVSRHLMVMGLGRLNWQALTPDGFNFMGSVSKDGKLSTTVVDHLESKVADHVASWAAIGWVMIILSFVVHVPYIAVIVLYESS
jgi:hypothetical protein